MPELAFEDRGELRRIVDRRDVARELDRRVVARRHAVLVLIPVPRDVGVGAEDRKKRARPLGDRVPDRIWLGEMQQDRVFAVVEEVRRDHDREIAVLPRDDQLSEVVRLEEVTPLGVVERDVVSVDEHQ